MGLNEIVHGKKKRPISRSATLTNTLVSRVRACRRALLFAFGYQVPRRADASTLMKFGPTRSPGVDDVWYCIYSLACIMAASASCICSSVFRSLNR